MVHLAAALPVSCSPLDVRENKTLYINICLYTYIYVYIQNYMFIYIYICLTETKSKFALNTTWEKSII